MLRDGQSLMAEQRHGGASHAFGLAAECAIKHAMHMMPGGGRQLPRKHLPDLVDDGKRWFSGRRHRGLFQLLNRQDYMAGWQIDNRYWQDQAFSSVKAESFRHHASRTCSAANLGV